MNYSLVDIHFHTNQSFDAYENVKGSNFSWEDLLKVEKHELEENKIKMIVKTDHNILDFKTYKEDREKLEENGIKYLPGIEINSTSKVHWIFIFDDNDLFKKNKGQYVGELLDEHIQSFYSYKNLIPSMIETKKIQSQEQNVGDFIDILHDLDIKYIAIPHLEKHGGWFDLIKKETKELNVVLSYLNDNIISGFESKHQNEFIKKKIAQTEYYINRLAENLDGLEVDQEDIERRKKHLALLKTLKNSFSENYISLISGSDFHGEYNGKKQGLKIYKEVKQNLFYMKSECTFEGLRFALLDQESRTFPSDRLKKYQKNESSWIKYILYTNSSGDIKKLTFKDGINSIIGARGTGKSYLIYALLGKTNDYQGSNIVKDVDIKEIVYANGKSKSKLSEGDYDIVFQQGGKQLEIDVPQIHEILSKAPYNTDLFIEKIKEFSTDQMIIEDSNDLNEYFEELNKLLDAHKNLYNHLSNSIIDYGFFSEYNNFISEMGTSAIWKENFNKFETFLTSASRIKNMSHNKLEKINTGINRILLEVEETKTYSEIEKNKESDKIINSFVESSRQLIEFYVKILSDIEKNNVKINQVNEVAKAISRKLSISLTNEEKSFNEKISNLQIFINNTFKHVRTIHNINRSLKEKKSNEISNIHAFEFDINFDTYRIMTKESIDFQNIDVDIYNDIFNNYSTSSKTDSFKKILEGELNYEIFTALIARHDKRRKSINLEMPKLEKSIYIQENDQRYKNILKMSQGERSDLLLKMVLNENTDKILILDQPEDDLDNETVFKTLIMKLRKLKHRRQIFIVTHNANICINSDSDTITTCENNGKNFLLNTDTMESTEVYNYSSINSSMSGRQIDIAVNILEGGKAALRKRVKAIGYKDLFFKEKEGQDNDNNF